MKGLLLQGELENPGGNFFVFKNGPGILKTKVKQKPTIKKQINFNMMWLQKAVSIITILKLQLRWLFRGPVPARLQPGETFPRKKACSSLQPCQSIQQSLFHTQNFLCFAPVWREGTFWPLPQHKVTHQLEWWGKPLMPLLPTQKIIKPSASRYGPKEEGNKQYHCWNSSGGEVYAAGWTGGRKTNFKSRLTV